MIRLTDEIAITADDMQYIVGRPYASPRGAVKIKNPKYYHKLSAALQQAVTDCVRAGVADERITELRQVVAEQARLEQEFSEKLKGVYERLRPQPQRGPGGQQRVFVPLWSAA